VCKDILENMDVAVALGDDTLIKKGLHRLLEGKLDKFSCIMQVQRKEEPFGLELTLSLVRDWMGELLGVLLIGQEVRGLKQFLSRFHLTWREWEIIQQVLFGATNKCIADHPSIRVLC